MNRAQTWTALAFSSLAVLAVTPGCDGNDSTGTGGAGGSTNSGGACTSGQTRPCYTGPEDTKGQGICQEGVEVCDDSGAWLPTCYGEVGPATEVYSNDMDEDCDGIKEHPADDLASTEIIVRYFLDEAATGKTPIDLEDAAPEPMALTLYSPPAEDTGFFELDGNRGLRWGEGTLDTNAYAPVDGKIGSALEGHTAATIEVVVAIDEVSAQSSGISYIGAGTELGRLALRSYGLNTVSLIWKQTEAGRWRVDLDQRCVLHLIVDTTQPNGSRAKLYRNGILAEVDDSVPVTEPASNDTIALGTGAQYVLGNRATGSRSFNGRLYYAALYGVALEENALLNNAQLLLLEDDGPQK